MPVKVAIVGSGLWAREHAKVFQSLQNVEISAIFSRRNKDEIKDFAQSYGAKPYASISQMIAEQDIDITVIASSTKHHYTDAKEAILAGSSVLIEKPIDVDTTKLYELCQISRDSGLSVGVVLPHRFDSAINDLKAIFQDGTLGEVLLVNLQIFYKRSADELEKILRGVSAPTDTSLFQHFAIHYYDAICFALNLTDIKLVSETVTNRFLYKYDETSVKVFSAKSKTVLTSVYSNSLGQGRLNKIEIVGTNSYAEIAQNRLTISSHEQPTTYRDCSTHINLKKLWKDTIQNYKSLSESRISLENLLSTNHLFPSSVDSDVSTNSESLRFL